MLEIKGYTSITIDGFLLNNITFDTLHHSLSNKHVSTDKSFRIIANQWLQNRSDFDNLFAIAQRIVLTSGDNTLNNAFGKGVIPIYATQQWNIDFRNQLIEKIILLPCIPREEEKKEELKNILTAMMPVDDDAKNNPGMITEQLISALNKLQANNNEMLSLLHAIIQEIQVNHNFDTKSMPDIVNKIVNFFAPPTQRFY